MPNLWGASAVGRVEGGRLYAARMVGRRWLSRRRCGCGEAAAREGNRGGLGRGFREQP